MLRCPRPQHLPLLHGHQHLLRLRLAVVPAPLKVGMLVVTAVADEQGDYESMKQIVSIDASGTTLSYHSDKPKAGDRIIRISGRDYREPDRAAAGP